MDKFGRSNLTHTVDTVIRKAAKSALFSWKQSEDGVDDLVNELWVWYLERPSVQKKLEDADEPLARKLVYRAALQILTGEALNSDRFQGRNLYSSDSIREALRGESKNRYLVDILPRALTALSAQNPGYAEELRMRYSDGIVPEPHSAQEKRLSRALKSLTEHVNVIVITAGMNASGKLSQGPGSRSAIFPETRRSKGGGHADPTGDTAIALIEHPELRDEFLSELPLQDFLRGSGA